MEQPLLMRQLVWLARLASLSSLGAAVLLASCTLFDDPLRELDPALRDSTLTALPASARGTVPRRHLLESFGSYGCVSCPEAESRLSPYIHSVARPQGIVVVNYHVKFGSISDPWITPATQAWNDAKGYVSLPQAVMDGSNAAYGIREKDVAFKTGEYDSLAARALRSGSESSLELRIDTAGIVYDTVAGKIRLSFQARNLGDADAGALAFRVLAVKNRSAVIPIYPTPWEVIVAELAVTDAQGDPLALSALAPLTAKTFSVEMDIGPETGKHVRPPPQGQETLADYGLVVAAQGRNGTIINVSAWKYAPR